MNRAQSIYWPALDHMGQKTVRWMLARHDAEGVLAWYRDHGYPVASLAGVGALPSALVEERVSRLREHWRRWLFGESAAALFMGPAGLLAGAPMLSMVLMGWAIEMGWAYGHDMEDPMRIDALRKTIHERLMRALGFPIGLKQPLSRWSRVMGTVLFWGFGPELAASDAVMAEIRRDFRAEWERRRAAAPPFTTS